MRFISANRIIKKQSLDQVKGNLEKKASLIIYSETVDQIDQYEVKMRVRIKGKGAGFYLEISTVITVKETGKGVQIIAHSDLLKPLIVSAGLASTCFIVFFVTHDLVIAIISFSIVLPIMFMALLAAIKRRAAELLRVLVKI